MKYYEKIDLPVAFTEILTRDFSELASYNIRFAIINVTKDDEDDKPIIHPLPYKVKLNSTKDKLLKAIDVEILIDRSYPGFSSVDAEQCEESVYFGALYQLSIVYKKDLPVYNDDGTIKLKLKKPDMVFMGFSLVAAKYEDASAEIKNYNNLKSEFSEVLY
jgi:hypothetical protein